MNVCLRPDPTAAAQTATLDSYCLHFQTSVKISFCVTCISFSYVDTGESSNLNVSPTFLQWSISNSPGEFAVALTQHEPILVYETQKFKFLSKLKLKPAIKSSFFLTLYVFIEYDTY